MKDVDSYKRALDGKDFMCTKKYQSILKRSTGAKFFIGHNRAATQGKISDRYAHPFEFENVIGVHNGTLLHHKSISPAGFDSQSDSETIYAAINELPPGKPDDLIKDLDGSFALVWYDKRDGNLYSIRNKERPLYLLPIKDKSSMVIVSEQAMGNWIISRNKLSVSDKAGHTKEGYLYTFNKDTPQEFTNRKVDLKPPINKTYYSNRYDNWYNDRKNKSANKIETDEKSLLVGDEIEFKVCSSRKESYGRIINGYYEEEPWFNCSCYIRDDHPNIDHSIISVNGTIRGRISTIREDEYLGFIVSVIFNGYKAAPKSGKSTDVITLYHGPNKKMITKEEFDEITKHDCAVCQGNIIAEDSHKYAWTQDNQPICEVCCREVGIKPGEIFH